MTLYLSRRLLLLKAAALTVAGALLTSACMPQSQAQRPSDKTIKIQYTRMQIEYSTLREMGEAGRKGMELALAEAQNRAGNFDVVLEPLGIPPDVDPNAWEAQYATKAVNDPDTMIYMPYLVEDSATITNKAGLATISWSDIRPGHTKPGTGDADEPQKYKPSGKTTLFRVIPANDTEGLGGALWAKQLGAKKVYILEDAEYGSAGPRPMADAFAKQASAYGIQIAGREPDGDKNTDFNALANKIKASGADVIYYTKNIGSNVNELLKALDQNKMTTRLMAAGRLYSLSDLDALNSNTGNRFYQTRGAYALSAEYPLPPYDQATPESAAFYKRYQARYGGAPTIFAIHGYDAMRVALAAIARAGKKDRAAILDALQATKDFPGLLGTFSFDANGDTSLTPVYGYTVRSQTGKPAWEYAGAFDAQTGKS